MTPRENAMAIFECRQPDTYTDFMTSLAFVIDPIFGRDSIPRDGQIHKDSWGTPFLFKKDAPGAHPMFDDETAVIRDITKWKEQLTVPTFDGLDWSAAQAREKQVDREKNFCAFFCTRGLFERSHHLMGMQNALVNYMLYPEEMAALLRVIADYKIETIKQVAAHLHPDVIFYHDDWGSKQNVFLPPDLWRELIKPLHTEIVKTAHDCGILFVHHADCICQPIVKDMVEMGIDIWQGVIPQNDIVEIQRITEGKLPMIGGIDGPAIDIANITEEAIRAEVRRAIDTYCPAGRFYPAIPNSRCYREWNNSIAHDEMDRYGVEWAQKHPILPGTNRPSGC